MRLVKCVCLIALSLSFGSARAVAEVVAVVSAKNPVTTLNKNQVTDIFLGKSSRFPDGSPAMPIDQSEGSTTRDEFYATVANKTPTQVKAHWSKIIFTGRGQPPKEVVNSSEVKKLLTGNPAAIGYIDRSALDTSVKVLTISP